MKTTLLSLLLLLVAFVAPAQTISRLTYKELDEKAGFRDLKFGVMPSEVKGLTPLGAQGENKFYTRPTDELKIGNATISNLTYIFFKEQLYMVQFKTKGAADFNALLQALKTTYGEPVKKGNRYQWAGDLVKLNFEEDPATHNGLATTYNIQLLRQKLDDDDKAKVSKPSVKGL